MPGCPKGIFRGCVPQGPTLKYLLFVLSSRSTDHADEAATCFHRALDVARQQDGLLELGYRLQFNLDDEYND